MFAAMPERLKQTILPNHVNKEKFPTTSSSRVSSKSFKFFDTSITHNNIPSSQWLNLNQDESLNNFHMKDLTNYTNFSIELRNWVKMPIIGLG